MLVEATLDFPEEDIDFLQQADAKGQLQKLQQHLAQIFACASQGQLLREGIHVVIAGQPNAGKSSLLNALAGAELAIVTPIAGTTRDKVQQIIQIEGVPLHVVDTAGLRDSEDEVERMGIERAWQAIADADAVLFLHDLTRADQADYQQADRQIADELQRRAGTGAHVIHLWNKADAVEPAHGMHEGIHLSAKTGKGLEDLRHALLELAGWRGTTEGIYMARERHLQALTQVREQLQLAQAQIEAAVPALDLLAEELRQAQNALNSITGEFTSDDLLGVIFSRFCIGK
jgi:tRNA modification GTPase